MHFHAKMISVINHTQTQLKTDLYIMQKEVSQLLKKGVALKSLCEISWEMKVSTQEMTTNVTGSAKTEHNSAIQIFQYKALKYIG